MSKEKKIKKRGYLQYIQKNAAGEYVYTGGYYPLQGGRSRSLLTRLFGFSVPAAACTAAAGVLPGDAMMNTFYVIIPYALAVCLTASVLWAAIRFAANEKPLREYVYKAAAVPIPRRAVASAIAAGLCVAGHVVFLCLHGSAHMWADAVSCALHAAALTLQLLGARAAAGAQWRFSAGKTITDNLG